MIVEWQSRLKRLFRFLSFGYEPRAGTVVVTLRLNTSFIIGAAVTATFLTLVFKYGGISFGSALELLADLWRGWSWLLVGVVVVLAILAVRARKHDGLSPASTESGFWPRLAAHLPKGLRGTALLCVALLFLLGLIMWASSGETTNPSPEVKTTYQEPQSGLNGLETPRLWRDLQTGKRK